MEAKANVGVEDAYKRTPLHYAAHTSGVLSSTFLFVPSLFVPTVTVPHSRHTLDRLDLLKLLLLHLMICSSTKHFF